MILPEADVRNISQIVYTIKKMKFIYSFLVLVISTQLVWTQVASSKEEVNPIKVGQVLDLDISLITSDGTEVTTRDLFINKQSIVIIYRGTWCPYCNRHLSEIGSLEKELIDLGYQIIAISPDVPDRLEKNKQKIKLNYTLVSDSRSELIQALGLAANPPNKIYKKLLNKSSGGENSVLPIPSLLIIDNTAKVKYITWDWDYKNRISGSDVLAKAKELSTSKNSAF